MRFVACGGHRGKSRVLDELHRVFVRSGLSILDRVDGGGYHPVPVDHPALRERLRSRLYDICDGKGFGYNGLLPSNHPIAVARIQNDNKRAQVLSGELHPDVLRSQANRELTASVAAANIFVGELLTAREAVATAAAATAAEEQAAFAGEFEDNDDGLVGGLLAGLSRVARGLLGLFGVN